MPGAALLSATPCCVRAGRLREALSKPPSAPPSSLVVTHPLPGSADRRWSRCWSSRPSPRRRARQRLGAVLEGLCRLSRRDALHLFDDDGFEAWTRPVSCDVRTRSAGAPVRNVWVSEPQGSQASRWPEDGMTCSPGFRYRARRRDGRPVFPRGAKLVVECGHRMCCRFGGEPPRHWSRPFCCRRTSRLAPWRAQSSLVRCSPPTISFMQSQQLTRASCDRTEEIVRVAAKGDGLRRSPARAFSGP